MVPRICTFYVLEILCLEISCSDFTRWTGKVLRLFWPILASCALSGPEIGPKTRTSFLPDGDIKREVLLIQAYICAGRPVTSRFGRSMYNGKLPLAIPVVSLPITEVVSHPSTNQAQYCLTSVTEHPLTLPLHHKFCRTVNFIWNRCRCTNNGLRCRCVGVQIMVKEIENYLYTWGVYTFRCTNTAFPEKEELRAAVCLSVALFGRFLDQAREL